MHIHILGICGTFMGSLALLARELGHKVSGSDINIYPPMSEMLIEQGIDIIHGHHIEDLKAQPDCVVVGNVMKRGMPIIEFLLNEQWPLLSGPEFLARHILVGRQVIGVAGTHGKTTTSSMIAWILSQAGLHPGFLIGGIPNNFGYSAQLGSGSVFVVEADEYDCAFFDKRAKFIHYHPSVFVINNIEFDHADIYRDLESIQQQFHFLIRQMPGNAQIVHLAEDKNIEATLAKGCWTPCDTFGLTSGHWNQERIGPLELSMLGGHNIQNAYAAIAAAAAVGVDVDTSKKALVQFAGVKRRLELYSEVNGVRIFEDFAHHPTAIQKAIQAMKTQVGPSNQLHVVVDFSSNTMRSGEHKELLPSALKGADHLYFIHQKPVQWDLEHCFACVAKPGGLFENPTSLIQALLTDLKSGDVVVCLSNGALAETLAELNKAVQSNVLAMV